MALHINIEDLLNKRKIESNRIEFKTGWNPDKIYHSICAFANDRDNIGGGYILIGVEEENGIAKRPVRGLQTNDIDDIQKEMVGFNNRINPFYMPHVDVEEVDGQNILVVWVPAGSYRPYNVCESVVAKKSAPKYYVRSGSSSVEAKGEVLDELHEMANRVPFDDRGNPEIKITDINPTLLLTHLMKVGSRLAENFQERKLTDVLDQMDLLVGPSENRWIKNVAAMMFCDHPEKFFPYTQVDIVTFPEGAVKNPNNMIELPKIVGPIPQMIKETLSYLRTNIVKERIIKPKDRAESIRFFNYPYQAIEEAVVNALYHRDYQEHEPVEITIEPEKISILSYAGPDRSITMEAIKQAQRLKARRYKNRRLGDFLKELELSEGRATGIPTIQDELAKNGSPKAIIETDDERSYFLIEIPVKEGFEYENKYKEPKNEYKTDVDDPKRTGNDLKNDPKIGIHDPKNTKEDESVKKEEVRSMDLLKEIRKNPKVSISVMAERWNVSYSTAKRLFNQLISVGRIRHIGSSRGGYWVIEK